MAQSPEQLQAARELAAQFGLTKDDFYQHRQSHMWLISRTGIEKIQYKAGIAVTFEAVRAEVNFAAVKALAVRKVKPEGAKTSTSLTIQTFGSACQDNCKISYFLEMAEKRALSRAVLKLSDFYQLGVYGEDEMPPAATLQAERVSQPAPALVVAAAPEAPKKSLPEASAPASAPQAASDGAGLSIAGPVEIPAEILEKLTRKFEAVPSGIELKKLWETLTKNEATALFDVKEAAKARLAQAAKEAAEQAARQAVGTMRVAGEDANLIDEFIAQPVTEGVATVVYATAEQRECITRLLDHPKIFRKEKTMLLLNLKKLDKERARQAIIKLRKAIADQEGVDPLVGARAQVVAFVQRNAGKLSATQAEGLTSLAASPEATLEFLLDALELAENALIDDETYGTDEELAAGDDIAIAA